MAGDSIGSGRRLAAVRSVFAVRLCRYGLTAERRAVRSVEEQQARVSAAAVAPRPVRVAIAEAQGLMCAEEVVTERPLPGFHPAAIDGYAVRSVDVLGVGRRPRSPASKPATSICAQSRARRRNRPLGPAE